MKNPNMLKPLALIEKQLEFFNRLIEMGKFGDAQSDNSSEWISVKEKLPEALTRVLAYGCGDISISFRRNGSWSWMDDKGNLLTEREISHWLPIPQTPKGEA